MKWNIVFLVDKIPFSKIVLLKRARNKTFAPCFYTGVGGKVEEGEGVLESAVRELKEETGIRGIRLQEFAQAILNNQDSLHYFWGVYNKDNLPFSEDGYLEWVSRDSIYKKQIIPSTLEMFRQLEKRNFNLEDKFTIYLTEINNKKTVRNVKLDRIVSGLTF